MKRECIRRSIIWREVSSHWKDIVMKKGIKDIFVEGAIPSTWIANHIAKHSSKTTIGAHSIFLGQIRADQIEGKTVRAIEYTAHHEMATRKLLKIREQHLKKHHIH